MLDAVDEPLSILKLAGAAPEPRPQRRHGRVRRAPIPQRRVAGVLWQMVSMGRAREALVRQDDSFRP